jgi:hypothetical protein
MKKSICLVLLLVSGLSQVNLAFAGGPGDTATFYLSSTKKVTNDKHKEVEDDVIELIGIFAKKIKRRLTGQKKGAHGKWAATKNTKYVPVADSSTPNQGQNISSSSSAH